MEKNKSKNIHSIGIFRALQLGDLLVAVPALRAVRQRFPAAEISLIGLSWAAEFTRRYHRYLDRFVEFPGYPGIHEVPFDAAKTRRFLERQHTYGYDLVIQMHGSGQSSNPFVRELHAKTTLGYYPASSNAQEAGLTLAAPYPETLPEIQRNLHLTGLLGCDTANTKLSFPLQPEDEDEISRLLPELVDPDRICIGIHPGARPPSRRWPVGYFAFVADTLAREYQAQILFTGAAEDEPLVEAVLARMEMPAHNLVGKTSLGGLAALLKRLGLFISNDTGPAHLASALSCPAITLFGPADYQRWAPLNDPTRIALRRPVHCSPCDYFECPIDHRCLRWLNPTLVLQSARKLLAEHRETSSRHASHISALAHS